jgi:distribution and morphology protein 12
MSFDINWNELTAGVDTLQIQNYLNEKFKSIERPNFLGQVEVFNISFGTIPPEIAVVNITDPLEEFYFEGSSQENSEQGKSGESEECDSHIPVLAKKDFDAQVELSIEYKGDMSMAIKTELIVNQPTPNFMSLPLTLTLTKTSLKANAIIAYLGKHINFCLREPEGESILRDLSIDSAIGDQNRQVLKNVAKIERFIVHQLTEFLNDFVVFPNYHTVYFEEVDDAEL